MSCGCSSRHRESRRDCRPAKSSNHRRNRHCSPSCSSSSSSSCSDEDENECCCEGKNYLFAYKTSQQQYTGPDLNFPFVPSFDTVLFDQVGYVDGWIPIGSAPYTQFRCPKTGLYEIHYTATVANQGRFSENDQFVVASPKEDVIFRVERNSTVIPASNSWSTLDESDALSGIPRLVRPTYDEISNTILVQLNQSDVISLTTAGTSSALSMPNTLPLLSQINLEPVKLTITRIK